MRGQDPILLGGSKKQRKEDEETLLDFAAHFAINMLRAASTIQVLLLGVRHGHITRGADDPLEGKVRLQ